MTFNEVSVSSFLLQTSHLRVCRQFLEPELEWTLRKKLKFAAAAATARTETERSPVKTEMRSIC